MRELLENIGRAGTVRYGALRFDVVVEDVKVSYGRVRYLVSPCTGRGSEWKEDVQFSD